MRENSRSGINFQIIGTVIGGLILLLLIGIQQAQISELRSQLTQSVPAELHEIRSPLVITSPDGDARIMLTTDGVASRVHMFAGEGSQPGIELGVGIGASVRLADPLGKDWAINASPSGAVLTKSPGIVIPIFAAPTEKTNE